MASRADMRINVSVNDQATKQLKTIESSIIRVVGSISAAFAAGAILLFPIKEAAEFERQMKDVQKTTGFSQKSIDGLSTSLIELSRTIGISAKELGGIAAIAGQLGLGDFGREAIEKFTESVAIASVTLGLSSQALAEFGSQATAIFNIGPEEVGRVFDSINELSNNTVASAKDIIDITKRIGPVASDQITEVLALAAATKQLGVTNEVGATFYTKLFPRFLTKAQKFADVMGVTKGHWEDIVATRGNMEALELVTQKISRLPKSDQIGQMIELGGEGSRALSVFAKATNDAGNSQTQLARALGISNSAYIEGVSSADEYAIIMGSVIKQLNVLKGAFGALAIEAGTETLGTLQEQIVRVVDALTDPQLQDFFTQFGKDLDVSVGVIGDAIAGLSQLTLAWTILSKAIAIAISYNLVKWIGTIAIAIGTMTFIPLVKGLSVVIGTLGAFSRAFTVAFALAVSATTPLVAGMGRVKVATNIAKDEIVLYTAAAKGATVATTLFSRVVGGIVKYVLPVVSILAVVGAVIYENWEAIKGFFGFVDAETKILERKARIAEKKAEDSIRKAKDAVRELNEQLLSGKTAVVEDPFGEFTSGKEQIAIFKEMSGVLSTFGLAMNGLNHTLSENNEIIEEQEDAYTDTKDELETLLERYKKTKAFLDSKPLVVGGLESMEDEIRVLTDRLANISEEMDRTNGYIQEATKDAENYVNILVETYGDSIAKAFDEGAVAYLKQKKNLLESVEAQKKANAKVKEYTRLQTKAARTSYTGRGGTQSRSNLQINLDEALKVKDKADEAATAAKKSIDILLNQGDQFDPGKVSSIGPEYQAFLDGLVSSKDANAVGTLVVGLETVITAQNKLGISSKSLIETQKESAKELILEKEFLQQASAAMEELSGTTLAYEKTAKSAFDNVGNELVALNNNLQDFLIDFQQGFDDRTISIDRDKSLSELDGYLEEEKSRLRTQAKAAIKIRGDGAKAAIEAELAEAIKSVEGDALNAKSAQQRTDIETDIAIKKQKVLDLIKRTNKEAKEGNVDIAIALRKDAKEEFKSMQGLLEQLQDLRGADFSGNVEAYVPEDDFKKIVSEYKALGGTLEEGLKDTAKAIKETAVQQAEEYNESLANMGNRLEHVIEKLKELSKYLGNINVIGEALHKAFPAVTDGIDLQSAGDVSEALNLYKKSGDEYIRVNLEIANGQKSVIQTASEMDAATKSSLDAFSNNNEKAAESVDDLADSLRRAEDVKKEANLPLANIDYTGGATGSSDSANEAGKTVGESFIDGLKDEVVSSLSTLGDVFISPASADITIPVETEFSRAHTVDTVDALRNFVAADPIKIPFVMPEASITDVPEIDPAKLEEVGKNAGREIKLNLVDEFADSFAQIEQAAGYGAKVNIDVEGPDGKDFTVTGREAGREYGESFGVSALDQMRIWQNDNVALAEENSAAYSEAFDKKFKELFHLDIGAIDTNTFTRSIAGALEASQLKMPVEALVDPVQLQNGLDALPPGTVELTGIITSVVNPDGTVTTTGTSVRGEGYASGGPISGPGTSTSDSIPIFASNGEFMIDAFTTRFFGGSFFSGLQSLARSGRRPKSKGGLPAMAGGGPITGGGGVTTLNLSLGGKQSTLYGAKEAVDTFVDALVSLEKGLA